MAEVLAALAARGDLVALPGLRELGARLAQGADQRLELGIADVAGAVGPELGDHRAGAVLPVDEHLAPRGVGERLPGVVAGGAGQLAEVSEQGDRGVVPGQIVPAAAEDVGGVRPEALDQAPERGGDALGRALARRRGLTAAEQDQVRALCLVESQRLRERLQNLDRRPHVAALLQPRVPGRSDPGELRDLLAAQARRPSPAPAGQAHVGGLQRGAAHAQEVRELFAAELARSCYLTKRAGAVVLCGERDRGGHWNYQYKAFSTTWISPAS